jgi:arylsulfatase A-like enzyme
LKVNNGINTVEYSNEHIQREALKFVKENKDNPFFMFVPTAIPHAELIVPDDEIYAQYKGKFEETPWEGNGYGEDYNPWRYCSQDYPRATFAAMVHRLDKNVGEIKNLLEELGIAENTLILFSSDNGPHIEGGADPDFFDSNGPLKGYKRDLYEGGVRVPTIAYWPSKIIAGSKTDHISAFWDFLPTVMEIAGGDVPSNIDGISFLPTLLGDSTNQKEHEYLYWEFHEKNKRQAIRMRNWKGVIYDIETNPDAELELYDLSKDIGEENNIADAHPEIVKELKEKLNDARTVDPNWKFFNEE